MGECMELSNIFCKSETLPLTVKQCSAFMRNTYSMTSATTEPDPANRLFAVLQLDDLVKLVKRPEQIKNCISNDFDFYGSGWQSWGFGGETTRGQMQKDYIPLIPQWKQYITFPGTAPHSLSQKKLLKGQFVIYFRWGTTYIVLASTGNVTSDYFSVTPSNAESFAESTRNKVLPPVQFYVDRHERTIHCTAYTDGKTWHVGEKIAELSVFVAYDFFALKDGISALFSSTIQRRFEPYEFINCVVDNPSQKMRFCGWESWYNHYADINEELISKDLDMLPKTQNLLTMCYLERDKPVVFQVDDGWEKALGDWEVNEQRFPSGMAQLASSIEDKGFVPGLWVAPFIVDWRSKTAREHRDWILRDKKGKPVQAGFHPLWGASSGKEQPGLPYSYFCLDLSNDEVLEHINRLMDTIINVWGFRYIKIDFLFAGMLNGVFKNGGCAYQWYDRALKVLTKAKASRDGKPVAYLGCGLPLESSFNTLPLSRIGPDTKESWDVNYLRKLHYPARTSAFANMQSTLGHAFWDSSVYLNDPDVVFMRYDNITLTDTEKELITLVNYLFSSQIMLSDDPVSFNPATEGYFTNHMYNLLKIFRGTEWAVQNKTADTYYIYNKNLHYVGFINLSDKDVQLYDGQIHVDTELEAVSPKDSFEPLLLHGRKIKNGYIMEKHSISIWELQNANAKETD